MSEEQEKVIGDFQKNMDEAFSTNDETKALAAFKKLIDTMQRFNGNINQQIYNHTSGYVDYFFYDYFGKSLEKAAPDLYKRYTQMTATAAGISNPSAISQTEQKKKEEFPAINPAWAVQDAAIENLWNRLQPLMKKYAAEYASKPIPARKSIWDQWSVEDWPTFDEIIGLGRSLAFKTNPEFNDFLTQYTNDYANASDRVTLATSVGAVVPSLYGHGNPQKYGELEANIEIIATLAPETAKILKKKLTQRFK